MDAQSLKRSWRSRTSRERTLVAWGLAAVALAALYAFLWDPGVAALRKLSVQLPRLHAQVEEMRALRTEIAALRAGMAKAGARAVSPALVQAALEADPAIKSTTRVQWRGADRLSLESAAIDFDRWLALVNRLQQEFGIRVEQCAISRLAQGGMVRIEATFSLPSGAAGSR